MRNYAEEPRELWHDSEYAHRLSPAVTVGALGGQCELIAEPLVEDIAEEIHACVHVEPSVVVHDLVSHDVGHGGPLRVAGGVLHIVDVLQQVVAHRKLPFRDVIFAPDEKLEIGVQLLVEFQDFPLYDGHLTFYPDNVHLLGD